MDSETVLQAIETNPVGSIRRVSGELSISKSSVIRHLRLVDKSIRSCWIVSHVTKILNCASRYQNIGKILTHSSIILLCEWLNVLFIFYVLYFVETTFFGIQAVLLYIW